MVWRPNFDLLCNPIGGGGLFTASPGYAFLLQACLFTWGGEVAQPMSYSLCGFICCVPGATTISIGCWDSM